MKLEEFYPVVKVMGEIFGNKLSPEATEIYYRLMSKYSIEEFKETAMRLLHSYKFNCMPKPANFIEIMTEIRKQKIIDKESQIKMICEEATEEDKKKIRDLVQGVVNKIGGKDA